MHPTEPRPTDSRLPDSRLADSRLPDSRLPEPARSWRHGFTTTTDADRFWDLLVGNLPPTLGSVDRVDRDDGSIHFTEGEVIFVHNPALDIRHVPADEWPAYISWWLDTMSSQRPAEIEKATRSWPQARSTLRVRLLPPVFPDNMICRPLTTDLTWGVAIELPGGSTPAQAGHPERWGQDLDTIWNIARRNTRRLVQVERTDVIAMERHLRLVEGDLFTTGVLDDLGSIVPEIRGDGALVVAPTSYSLLIQPIEGWDGVAEDASRLLIASLQYQNHSSHPLPPALLWYRGPGDLVGAAEFAPTEQRPFAVDLLAPEPLRSALEDRT